MITGYDYVGAPITTAIPPNTQYKWVMTTNIVLDDIYAEEGINMDIVENGIPAFEDWNYDTIFHANFNNLHAKAGNSEFLKTSITKQRIKRRLEGDTQWRTIHEEDVDQSLSNPFDIVYWDYLEPSRKNIEYSYVVVINGAEEEVTKTSVYSEFKDYFVVGQDNRYPVVLNSANEVTYNRESNTVVSPGNKYPYVINNGIAQYYSGTLTGGFYEFINIKTIQTMLKSLKNSIAQAKAETTPDTNRITELQKQYNDLYNRYFYTLNETQNYDYEFDRDANWKLRKSVDKFLADGRPKIIKNFEGDMWLANIVGSLPRSVNDDNWRYVTYNVDWSECGDPYSIGDLYDYGFINTDVDRE